MNINENFSQNFYMLTAISKFHARLEYDALLVEEFSKYDVILAFLAWALSFSSFLILCNSASLWL